MKKRVAVIIPGGVGVGNFSQGIPALTGLLERIAQRHELTVYSMVSVDRSFVPRGYHLSSSRISNEGPYLKKLRWLMFRFLKDHFRRRYDLVHAFWAYPEGYIAVMAGKLLGIPVVVSLQGGETARLPEIGYGNMLSGKRKKRTLWTCGHAVIVTVLSGFQAGELEKYGCLRKDIRVIPYGADTRLFAGQERRWKKPCRFLHVANLNPVKDQLTLLKTFLIVSGEDEGLCLEIAGNGPLEEELKTWVREQHIEDCVRFLGAVPHEQLPAHYAAADLLLHTSLYEAEGVVIAEAMAGGVLVAGTRTGLVADLEGECCVAVEPGDYRGLARKIKELMNDEERVMQLRQNARNWAIAHDADWTAGRFLEAYSEIFSRGKMSGRY